jgi:hypothetical protein
MAYLYLLMVVWVVLQVFWPTNPSKVKRYVDACYHEIRLKNEWYGGDYTFILCSNLFPT